VLEGLDTGLPLKAGTQGKLILKALVQNCILYLLARLVICTQCLHLRQTTSLAIVIITGWPF